MVRRLKFKDPLVASARDPIPTKTLLQRLEKLHGELSGLDQDGVTVDSLETVKDDLVNKKLLRGSNHGVQAFVACNIADILRLYAPDAPYNASQLSEIFKLFFRQLGKLDESDSGYYTQQEYLLSRMVEVKVAVLLTDLPDADKLTTTAFETVLRLVDSRHFNSQELEAPLLELLTEIISESGTLPNKAMKLLLNKFLAHAKATARGGRGTEVAGFSFTLKLCSLNADRLSRLVTVFLSEQVYDATADLDAEEEDEEEEEEEEGETDSQQLQQLRKIHLTIVEVWHYVPEMLASVMGLVNNELEADDVRIRVIATQAVSQMLACKTSPLNFVSQHRDTYDLWIKKPRDVAPIVRTAWIKSSMPIFEARSDIVDDLRNGLLKTLVDSNERVRLATVSALRASKPDVFLHRIANDTLMDSLRKLLRERNVGIRKGVMDLLTHLYNVFSTDSLVNWVPDELLKLVYINDKVVNAQVDSVLFQQIFPYDEDNSSRINRILQTTSKLTDKGKAAFFAIVRRQAQLAEMLPKTLDLAEEYTQDHSVEDKLDRVCSWFAEDFPASWDAYAYLKDFLMSSNHRLFRLMRVQLTGNYDSVYNSMNEVFSNLPNSEMKSRVIRLLCYRSANILYNKSNVPEIIALANNPHNELHKAASELLDNISTVTPSVLKSSISNLIKEVEDGNASSESLKAIRNFVEQFPSTVDDKMDTATDFAEKLVAIASNGTNPWQAKHAVWILANSQLALKDAYLQDIVDSAWPLDENAAQLNTHLAAIAEIYLIDMALLDPLKTKELSNFLASRILLRNQTVGRETEAEAESEPETEEQETRWISDEELLTTESHCLSKLLALRILTNWLRAIRDDDPEDIDAVADPIFNMLRSIIGNGGEIVSQKDATFPTPRPYQSRLRLEAGLRLLKLAEVAAYDTKLNQETVNQMVYTIQDEDEHVRRLFIRKLAKRLTGKTIPNRFVPLVFFVAHEPDKALKEEAATWIRAAFHRQLAQGKNNLLFENSYVRLLDMLSHHQQVEQLYIDYQEDSNAESFEALVRFTLAYLVFTLGLISTQSNASLLFYLTQRIKQYKDNGSEDNSVLYFISDLAQLTIKKLCEARNWNLATWPGKLSLPADLFDKNTDSEQVKDIVSRSYIPQQFFKQTEQLVRQKCRRTERTRVHKQNRTTAASTTTGKRSHILSESNRGNDNEEPLQKKLAPEHPTRKSRIHRREVDYNEQ